MLVRVITFLLFVSFRPNNNKFYTHDAAFTAEERSITTAHRKPSPTSTCDGLWAMSRRIESATRSQLAVTPGSAHIA